MFLVERMIMIFIICTAWLNCRASFANAQVHLKYAIILAIQHIRPVDDDEDDSSMAETGSRRRRSSSCENEDESSESEGRRVRRSCVIIPSPPPKLTDPPRVVRFQVPDNLGFDGRFFFPNQTPNYNLSIFESSCLFWNEQKETWTGEGCKVNVL